MSDAYRELLLGCGHKRDKLMGLDPGTRPEWHNLTTLDCYPECEPDWLWNLNNVPWRGPIKDDNSISPAKIPDDYFDEVHAYEVLEHIGHQGNVQEFFEHFGEIYRILKPGGHLFATCPARQSPWLWGDPSHRRVIQQETLIFLDQSQYTRQQGKTAMSDFRHIWKGDFKVIASQDNNVNHIFCLQAVKPSRISV